MSAGRPSSGTGQLENRSQPLRFAILCAGERLEDWQARCVEHLLAAEGVVPAAVLVAKVTRATESARRGLGERYARRLRRRQPHTSVDVATLCADVPRARIELRRERTGVLGPAEADLATIRGFDLDFVLSLGVDQLAGPVVDIPRFGIWAFDFDRDWTGRIGLAEYRRLAGGEPTTQIALLRVTPAVDRGVVLRQGWFRIDNRAPLRGLAKARNESAKWPASMCTALRRGDSSRLEGPVVGLGLARQPIPGSIRLISLALVQLRNRLRFAWRRLFRHPQWNIGIIDRPIQELLGDVPHPPVRWFPLAGRRGFLADPFGLRRGADATIVCEYFDYRRGKGTICSIDASGGFTTLPRPALELPVHMSYPYLVEEDGALYCIPETNRVREVSLFKAGAFPVGWEKVGSLLTDVSAMDPTVFRHGGRWWLMCTDGDADEEASLLVWHAPRLEGPWAPHAANPVKIDVRSARPAGTPFESEGRLYRPAQDCSRAYGGRIVINHVTRLTPDEFAEETVAAIEPESDGPYPAGRHTLSAFGDTTLVDGHRFVFVGMAFAHVLRIMWRDHARRPRQRLSSIRSPFSAER